MARLRVTAGDGGELAGDGARRMGRRRALERGGPAARSSGAVRIICRSSVASSIAHPLEPSSVASRASLAGTYPVSSPRSHASTTSATMPGVWRRLPASGSTRPRDFGARSRQMLLRCTHAALIVGTVGGHAQRSFRLAADSEYVLNSSAQPTRNPRGGPFGRDGLLQIGTRT